MILNKDGKRQSYTELVEILMKYDVISFDIFDTLILRPFSKPSDLFKFLGMRYSLSNFNKVRNDSSKIARGKTSNNEVFIGDIYREVNKFTNINVNLGVQYEFEAEKNLCYANPYMKKIYDTLLKKGKELIIISDMYYSSDQIKEILDRCGIKKYKKLYVSCDYSKSKKNGDLFEFVDKKYKNKHIIHIGDNFESDVLSSNAIGWDCYYYPKTVDFDKEIIKYKMSYNYRSVYNAMIQNKFHNGLLDQNFTNLKYKYGYSLGGFLAIGYVKWIHDIAIREGYDKILFLSRDCDILKKVYDYMYNDIPSEYVFWSRRAGIDTAPERDLSYFIFQFIDRRLKFNQKITVEELLKDADLEFLFPKLKKMSIAKNDLINRENCDVIIELLKENIDDLRQNSEKYKKAAKKYFTPILKGCSKVLIVDIGWKGSSIISLKYLIEEEWKFPIKVSGTLIGNYAYKKGYDTSMLNNECIRTYVFSENLNTDYALIHQKNLEISNSIVETLFTAEHPSFIHYELRNGNAVPIFSINNENSQNVVYIQQGIMDFCKDYIQQTKYFKELVNISGRDAYTPIISVLSNDKLLDKFFSAFSDYKFIVTIGGLTQNGKEMIKFLPEMISMIKQKNNSAKKRKVNIRTFYKKIKNKLKKIFKDKLWTN